MFQLVMILILLAAVLLIVVVLAQNPKGGGLSDQFGGSASSQIIGVKRTGDLLEKVTWGLLIAVFALTIVSKAMLGGPAEEAEESKTEITTPVAPTQQPAPAAAQPANEAIESLNGEGEKKEGD